MRRGLAGAAATALVVGVLVSVGPVATAIDRWRTGDVVASPSDEPVAEDPEVDCDDLPEIPDDTPLTLQLGSVDVRHGRDGVVLTARYADVPDAEDFRADVALQTDYQYWAVAVDTWAEGGPVASLTDGYGDVGDNLGEGGCESFAVLVSEVTCRGIGLDVDPEADRIQVVVPRRCLHNPEWVRAGRLFSDDLGPKVPLS
jgi:hypothetical protein